MVRCARCGLEQPAPPMLPGGLRRVSVCPRCLGLIVTEQGEMGSPEDRTDESWGGLGWT